MSALDARASVAFLDESFRKVAIGFAIPGVGHIYVKVPFDSEYSQSSPAQHVCRFKTHSPCGDFYTYSNGVSCE